ncbi:hypothetical protein [Lysobacter gummosus]
MTYMWDSAVGHATRSSPDGMTFSRSDISDSETASSMRRTSA